MDLIKRLRPVEVSFPDFGVFVLESHHGKDFYMESMAHDYAKLVFVIDGMGVLETTSNNFSLAKGKPIFIPKKIKHRFVDDQKKPLSLYIICLTGNCMPASASSLIDSLPLTLLEQIHNSQHWHERFRSLLFEQMVDRPDRSIVMLEAVFWILVQVSRYKQLNLNEVGNDASSRVKKAVLSMEHNFYRHQTLKETSIQAEMSERRFSQLFREQMGKSWLTYLRELRIDHACTLLEQTDRSVTTVAFECGFSDISNFYRAFRVQTGKNPLLWRQDALKNRPV